MSRGLHRSDNGEQDVELCDTIQRADMERLDGNAGHMRQESNQRNQHEQSDKPCKSDKCDCDPGTNATCTCTGAASGHAGRHTSFPCAHCNDYVPRDNTNAECVAATSASRENVSTGIRASNEPRNFKQANADSGDSVERRIGIPAGVTI